MSISINSSKRSFDESTNPPKRVKTEEINPGQAILNDTDLTAKILAHSTIAAIGNFARVSRQANAAAQIAFLHKACAIGYSVQDSTQAKIQIQKIYQYLRIVFEFQANHCKSIDDAIFSMTNRTLSNILKSLTKLQLYKDPYHPLLELLEIESSWKNAKVGERQLTQEEQSYGQVALRYAAYHKRPQLVKLLLEHQIDPNLDARVINPNNPSAFLPRPVYCAVSMGDFESLKHLLNHGAGLNNPFTLDFQMIDGHYVGHPRTEVLLYTFGLEFVRKYHPASTLNIPMLNFLVENGANITENTMIDAVKALSIDLLQALRDKGGNFDAETATKALCALIEEQAGRKNFSFDTPLTEMLTFLIEQGADVNGTEWDRPLNIASSAGSLPWVQYLVNHGAQVHLTDDRDVTPLILATGQGAFEVVEFLLKNGAEVNQVMPGADENTSPSALSATCFIKDDDVEYYHPNSNNPELVKLLLSYGAKPILEGVSQAYSPLNLARKNGLTEIVKILEDHIASSQLNE